MSETVTGTVTATTSDGDAVSIAFTGTMTVTPPVVPPPSPPPPGGTVLTGQGQITQGDYLIQADQWNSPSGQMQITTAGTAAAPGFQITADTENVTAPGAPGSYPSIIYGYGYQGPYTPNCKLPIQISQLTPGLVKSTYETTQVPGAAFDCSYDNWFAHSGTPVNQNAGLELMIWLAWGGGVEAGGPLHASNVTIGGNTFNVYFGTGNADLGSVYCLSTTPLTSLTIDMYDFAEYLVSQGWLDSTYYLTSIEAGYETWHGNEGASADSFTVTIGGTPSPAPAKAATLQDPFSGTTLNAALWTPILTGTGSVVVNDGLSLTDTAGSATYVGTKSVEMYDLTGSEVYVQLAAAGTQAPTTQAILEMQNAAGSNALEILVSNGKLDAQSETAGVYATLATVTYNPATMAWVRIRETGGTVYFEYAQAPAGAWTVLYSYADPFALTSLYVLIQQGSYSAAGPAATSRWANLNTVPSGGSGDR